MKKIKSLISLLLTLTMLVSVFAVCSVSAAATVTEIPFGGFDRSAVPAQNADGSYAGLGGTQYLLKYNTSLTGGVYTFKMDVKADYLYKLQLAFLEGNSWTFVNNANLLNDSGCTYNGTTFTDCTVAKTFAKDDYATVEVSMNYDSKSAKIVLYAPNGDAVYTKVQSGLDAKFTKNSMSFLRLAHDGGAFTFKNISLTKTVTDDVFSVTSVKNGSDVVTEGAKIKAKDGLTVTLPVSVDLSKISVVNNADPSKVATVKASADGKTLTVSGFEIASSYKLTVAKDAAVGYMQNMDNDYVLNFNTDATAVTEIPFGGFDRSAVPAQNADGSYAGAVGTQYLLKYNTSLTGGVYTFKMDVKADYLYKLQLAFLEGNSWTFVNNANILNDSGCTYNGTTFTDCTVAKTFAKDDYATVEVSMNYDSKSAKIVLYAPNGDAVYTKVQSGLDAKFTKNSMSFLRLAHDGGAFTFKNMSLTKTTTTEKLYVTSVKNGETVVTDGAKIKAKDGLTVTLPVSVDLSKVSVVNNADPSKVATVKASADGKTLSVSGFEVASSYKLTVAKDAAVGYMQNMDNDYVLNFNTDATAVTEIPFGGFDRSAVPVQNADGSYAGAAGTQYLLKYNTSVTGGVYTFKMDVKATSLYKLQIGFFDGNAWAFINDARFWNEHGNSNCLYNGETLTDCTVARDFAKDEYGTVEVSMNYDNKSAKLVIYSPSGEVLYTKVQNGLDAKFTKTNMTFLRLVHDGGAFTFKNMSLTKTTTTEKLSVTSVKNGETVVTEGSKIEIADGLAISFPVSVAPSKISVVNNTDALKTVAITPSVDGKTFNVSGFDSNSSYKLTVAKDAAVGYMQNMDNDYVLNFETGSKGKEVLLDLNFEDGVTQIGSYQNIYKTIASVENDSKGSKAMKVTQGNNNDQQFAFNFATPATSGKVLVTLDYRFENHSSWFHSFAGLYKAGGDFWTSGAALCYNETFVDTLHVGSVSAGKGAGNLGTNGNDSYNTLTMLVDLDSNKLRIYQNGIGTRWYQNEAAYAEYDIADTDNLGRLFFKYGTLAGNEHFHGKDSSNPSNSVYWFDNIKAVTVPEMEYIGGTFANGSEDVTVAKYLDQEFNFSEDISSEYFDENGNLKADYANLFTLKKNGVALNASAYSVSLASGKTLNVRTVAKAGDTFEFTMSKAINETMKADFVHTVSFDANPVDVTLSTESGELEAGVETTVTVDVNVKGYKVIVATYEGETLLDTIEFFNEGDDISVTVTPTENTIVKVFTVWDDNIVKPFVNAIEK